MKKESPRFFIAALAVLPSLSVAFLVVEKMTHYEFFYHLAAIPLEILVGAFMVERYLAKKEKDSKRRQLMYIKSYLFRSEMRNVFINNFRALEDPPLTLAWIKSAGLDDLRAARGDVGRVRYVSPEAMEPIVQEYVHAQHVFITFMEWAINNGFDDIFHDMIYLLHFIQDVKLYKSLHPGRLFMHEAGRQPALMAKVERVLRDGVVKFLDYAVELKEKQPDVFDELLSEYVLYATWGDAPRSEPDAAGPGQA